MAIRSWNGSAWIKPQFWTGSAWKRQVDAAAAVMSPVGNYTFDSNVQGWFGSEYDQAGEPYWKSPGYIRQDITQDGLLSASYMSSPSQSLNGDVAVGTQYRAKVVFQLIRRSGSLPNTITYTITCGDSVTEVTRAEGNSGWLTVSTPLKATTSDFQNLSIRVEADCGDLSGDSLYSVEVDSARIENSSGGLLMYESAPAVEAWPKWWNGSAWV